MNRLLKFITCGSVDDGKSTLSDRIIELTHGLEKREMQNQVLDSMDIERERGITIKLNAVSLNYHDPIDNQDYVLNLIDTYKLNELFIKKFPKLTKYCHFFIKVF